MPTFFLILLVIVEEQVVRSHCKKQYKDWVRIYEMEGILNMIIEEYPLLLSLLCYKFNCNLVVFGAYVWYTVITVPLPVLVTSTNGSI